MIDIVYLNGRFLPAGEAQVSVMDRGFLFGDGIYEVIPVYAGRLFRLAEHLQRLDNSLAGIRLDNPLEPEQWTRVLNELVERNGGGDLSLYLQVTRGPAPKRDHAFPPQVMPTVFAMVSPLIPPDAERQARGVRLITLEDIRWRWCHIKSIALLGNVLLKQQALDSGHDEAILVRDGLATEGSASNLFAVIDNLLVTPPKSADLLPGITRDLLLELARTHGMPCAEKSISQEQLLNAQEIWITSSTREVAAAVELDGKPVGNGRPGDWWQQMNTWYQAYKTALKRGEVQ